MTCRGTHGLVGYAHRTAFSLGRPLTGYKPRGSMRYFIINPEENLDMAEAIRRLQKKKGRLVERLTQFATEVNISEIKPSEEFRIAYFDGFGRCSLSLPFRRNRDADSAIKAAEQGYGVAVLYRPKDNGNGRHS